MNHSTMGEVRSYLIKQLVFFDEQLPLFLDTYYPAPHKEKTVMHKSVEQYVVLLEKLLGLDDVTLMNVLNQIALIGSRVTVCYEEGSQETFTVVLPTEVDPDHNRISFFSPLGNQLLSRAAGDRLNIETPGDPYPIQILEVAFG